MNSSPKRAESPVLNIEQVNIRPGQMILYVASSPGVPRFTNEKMAARALEMHPTLGAHSCINAKGPTFSAVISRTFLPHLLEHLVIAEMVQHTSNADATFLGTTEEIKTNEAAYSGGAAYRARIAVSFTDDLEAIEALGRAQTALGEIVNCAVSPNSQSKPARI